MKRIVITILAFLTWWLPASASAIADGDTIEAILSRYDAIIAQEHQAGQIEKEAHARWQKILTLKNFSRSEELFAEAEKQMAWFSRHQQWDTYYRTWQLKNNVLSMRGKLQLALQETQHMLSDAKERNNKIGRAMAYKQIGVIYLNMKQTEPAIEALKRYADLMKDEEDDFSSMSSIYYRMAKAYDYDKFYNRELQVTNEWLDFLHNKVGKVKQSDVRECYNACYQARAAAFIGLDRFDEAKLALDTAAHHAHLINRSLSLHHLYKMQARYYLACGDAEKALLYTDSVKMTTNEKDDHTDEIRAQALILQGKGIEAAQIYQRLYHDKDSVFGHETRQHLDELNTLFQVDELKTEQQRTRFRYTLITATSIVLALLVLLIFGWRSAIRQRKANEQLRLANDQAKVSSRMKSEFIRNISHEIRTPLNVISGFTQILTTPDLDLPEKERADMRQRVTENTDRITTLVDHMLELSDISSETVIERNDQTDARALAQNAIDLSGITLSTRPGKADAPVVFKWSVDGDVQLRTNKVLAARALAQLLENAVKFTHEGSIVLRMDVSEGAVLFAVEDTGVGIPAYLSDRIFEEFVQASEFTEGTGIGLTIAHSLARRMGGDLWLDKSYSRGARFILKLLTSFVLTFLMTGTAFAQQKTAEQMGGVYYAYPVTASQIEQAPTGYAPVYIWHYGRHGSRWLTNNNRYEWMSQQFSDTKNLTPLGKSVKKRLAKACKNAKGNGGQLTPLGARQHEEIARRMGQNFPQLFTGENYMVTARSSVVNRCQKSMHHFVTALYKQHNCRIAFETDSADMAWIAYVSPEMRALENSLSFPLDIKPDRFVGALFLDPSKVENPGKLLTEMHTLASDMQDVELPISFFDIFTPEEIKAVYDLNNRRMVRCNADEILNEGIPARSALSLWHHLEAEVDARLASGQKGADLHFGHDTNLYRLLNLIQLPLSKRMDEILPMAANLQMVFYRNQDGDILVQFLHNEKSVKWEKWSDMKQRMAARIHHLEHLRQLCALNTMVGTAPANTRTAGLFGKGSEEHGQTLPAVLVPNGQNFWTPQTRDTEKKCVAPYYYTDSLFQGIRNSHWIVGGCTQDYGSFTVMPLTGKLRLVAEQRASRFSHADEVSRPHYYALRLPDEQLQLELTGASHAAKLRVTPEKDGLLHLVVQCNSDEGEGFIEVDTVHRRIVGYNPVHRIYQGWGEPAGFSGYFLLQYTDEIVDFGRDGQVAYVTFRGKPYQPMVFTMASSFTDMTGALNNLKQEAEGKSFDEMAESTAAAWLRRLHTIDVEDADTARVNQFYGALYRTSFLPREMSDVDGRYPKFADGTPQTPAPSASGVPTKFYGDFSMWDTYRAVHPLLNIIAPQVSGEMMQSLVTMYEEGGWLPIFPCWNSYTAAMIGDHCSVVLADAYVKGIQGFHAEKAYEAMRKNAFETPASFDAYKNGMGRRALDSYLKYGYIPLEDGVKDAFHTDEQTSRTLEYAFDDFAVAQMAKALGKTADYQLLMRRSENWRNVINPLTGYCDGRHQNGRFENNQDFIHRKSYITEGATCHYTWYVPQNVNGLVEMLGGNAPFEAKLDSMFTEGRYWHGNEPCHQVAYLYDFIGKREKTIERVNHILDTEYNDTPGGLSGNDDAGQMSAWYVFSSLGFYPVTPATNQYMLGAPRFQQVRLNLENGKSFTLTPSSLPTDRNYLTHEEIMQGN